MNTDKSMQEMMKQLAIPPERMLIETYGEQIKELEAPAEIMDDEGAEYPVDAKEPFDAQAAALGVKPDPEPVTVVHEAGIGKAKDAVDPEAAEIDRLAAQDKGEAVDKVKEEFDGKEVVEAGKKLDEQSNEFLEGLKKDNKEEYKSEKLKALPENFFEFMTKAKAILKEAGKVDMYADALHTYSIKVLSEVKDDKKKQCDVRLYVEALLEEEGVL